MNPDYPICSAKQDRLGRSYVSRRIADTLLVAPAEHSIVFGLSGSWGSGKTSVLNMVKERLAECDEENLVVVPFNPWGYPSSSNLVTPFFDAVSYAITQAIPHLRIGEKARDLAQAFLDYGKGLFSLADLFLQAPIATSVFSALKARIGKRNQKEKKSPEELKQCIADKLEKNDLKIVVMIDDLDRLPSEGVRSVFQLIAAIADFPRVSYILAYDRANVVAALSEVQGCDGDIYLEKIIQIPFELPKPSPELLKEIFVDEINAIFDSDRIDGRESIELRNVCFHVGGHLRSVRDIRRLMNVFEVERGQVQDKITPADLLGVVALRVFTPDIIPWMGLRRSVLCGSVSGVLLSNSEAEEKREAYLQEISAYLGEDSPDLDFAFNLLSILFPHFASACGALTPRTNDASLEINRKIASSGIFDRYFSGLIEPYRFPRKEALNLLASGEIDELTDFFSRRDFVHAACLHRR